MELTNSANHGTHAIVELVQFQMLKYAFACRTKRANNVFVLKNMWLSFTNFVCKVFV